MRKFEEILASNIGNRLTQELAVGLLMALRTELARQQQAEQGPNAPAEALEVAAPKPADATRGARAKGSARRAG